jgi:uncharacterized membrane protein YoaT (DUF817 family)
MLALIVGTHLLWPEDAPLARYDFLVLASVAVQIALLALKLERWDEAVVVLVFHVVGTVMEVFKTAHGSWIYPEPGLLKIGGVPLFSGFMYACIGSYIARVWRLMDFRFVRYPPVWTTWVLAIAAYLNFFTHHYGPDIRLGLFAASALLFGRTWVVFTPDRVARRMPLLLGFVLVALFIWLAENLGTLAGAWAYPSQRHGWHMVSIGKLGAWYLLMLLSYVLVTVVHRPRRASPQVSNIARSTAKTRARVSWSVAPTRLIIRALATVRIWSGRTSPRLPSNSISGRKRVE